MPRWFYRARFRLRTVLGRQALEAQLDEELRFHLEMQTDAHIRMGATPSAAYAMALRDFGRIEEHKDDYRDRWGARLIEAFVQDVRGGVRGLIGHPLLSAAIVVALALGIGANTAVFTVFNAIVLNPPPYEQPERLIRLKAALPGAQVNDVLFSAPEIRDLRARAGTLSGVAEFHYMYFILLDQGEPQRVSAGVVSANFFSVIGVPPLIGRGFVADEEKAGAPGVIVLSHGYWMRQFGGDRGVIGRQVEMNDRVHRIVGVLPPLPNFPEEADIYLPTSACPLRISPEADGARTMRLVSALARMDGGPEDLSQVSDELSSVAAALRTDYPDAYGGPVGLELSAIPVNDDLTGRFRPTLLAMTAAATFLLLILCASVGALLLARTLNRRSELAMRTALGAWKGRLFRQFVTETIVLTGLGAALGLILAFAALPPLVAFAGQFTSRASEIHVDRTALVFTLTVSVLTALFFGSLITLAANFEGRGLRGSEPIGGGWMRRPIFKTLIVVQIAVSFGLLSGAGLMLRTLNNLAGVETGLSAGDALTMRLSLDFVKYWDGDRRAAYFKQLLDRLAETPGIDRAAAAGTVPFIADGLIREELVPAGVHAVDGTTIRPTVGLQVTSGNYFDTVGQTLLEGRTFTDEDNRAGVNVVVINKTLADRYWSGRSPLGETMELPVLSTVPTVHSLGTVTIVGVVSDARQRLDQAPIAKVYRPILQDAPVQVHLVVRGSLDHAETLTRVRAALRAINPRQPIDSVQTFDDARQASLSPTRTTATLLSLFALIALVISAVGIGGVVGSSVNRRTSEFGVMMALGAERRQVLALVLREGLALAAAGLVGGLFIAVVFTRWIRGLLFEVDQNDPLTLLVVGLVLLLVTLGACLLPARRAAGVDPMRALRCV